MADDRIKFKTLTELQEKYPVGSVFSEIGNVWIHDEYYYNDTDLKILKQKYDLVIPISKGFITVFSNKNMT